jgi:hypothetical protein
MSRRIRRDHIIPARGLTTEQAASYVGCSTVEQFEREVKGGIWPPPFNRHSRPKRWDIAALDRTLDQMSGIFKNHSAQAANPLDHASVASNAFEERARSFSLGDDHD